MVQLGMTGIAFGLAALFVIAVHRVRGARAALLAALGIAAWLAAFAGLAMSRVLERYDARPPPLLLAILGIIAAAITLARSRLGRALADELPVAVLVGFHVFRLPLELVMHEAARAGIMPVQMSFAGWNFDIVTGLTAIPVAWLAAKGRAPRWLLLAWNALGSILLLTIMTIAIVSTPVIAAFGRGAAENTFVVHVPYVWLPSVMVALAFAGHLLLWRRLPQLAPKRG